MRTHADIVRSAGSPEVVAVRYGVSVHTVRSWITRNRIPAEHWRAFAANGETTTDELASSLAREVKRARAA